MNFKIKKIHEVNPVKVPLHRLLRVQKLKGMNSKDFAESIGLTGPAFHNLKTRNSKISRPLAYAVELKTGISAEWILTGEGKLKSDPRNRLDLSEQVVLEIMVGSNINAETLQIFVFQNLERNISKAESDFSMATGALVDEKAMNELQKRSGNKLKYIGELSGIIDELKSGNLDQICINPLLLAIYYKDEWENVRERSKDYKDMLSYDLKTKFEEVLKKSMRILNKIDSLYRLNSNQHEKLRQKLLSGEWIRSG